MIEVKQNKEFEDQRTKLEQVSKQVKDKMLCYEAAVVVKWLSSWLAEQGVCGWNHGLATWISGIGYLLLQSWDMTERL